MYKNKSVIKRLRIFNSMDGSRTETSPIYVLHRCCLRSPALCVCVRGGRILKAGYLFVKSRSFQAVIRPLNNNLPVNSHLHVLTFALTVSLPVTQHRPSGRDAAEGNYSQSECTRRAGLLGKPVPGAMKLQNEAR